jgi:hypothetical protein
VTETVQFGVSPNAAAEVRAIIEAHLAYEHAQSVRQLLVHLLAALGGLIALCLRFPEIASAEIRTTLLIVWGGSGTCAVVAAACEWWCHHREKRLLTANKMTRRD